MLSSTWLDSFVVFAEFVNFTHAARVLHLSQPALYLQITKLAEEVGVPLYRRVGHKLELTAAGVELAAFAREAGERSRRLVEELRTGHSHQPVTLAAGSGAFLYLLGPAIKEFRRRCAARLVLLQRERVGTLDAVRTGAAHLGVAPLDSAPAGLESERLISVPQVLVVPARHRLARRRTVHLTDLADEALVVPPEGQPQRSTLAQALGAAGVPWQVAVEATGWNLVLRFVELGLGLTVVNGCCKLPRGLVARPLKELPPITYFLLTRTGAGRLGEAAVLRKVLLERVESAGAT